MERIYRIVAINPGSTSTKVALFENEKKIFTENISHSAQELAGYPEIIDQLPYRKETILAALTEHGVDLNSIDAFSGRCTGFPPMAGGVYEVNPLMCEHGRLGLGSKHPGNLGPLLARAFADEYGGRAFVVNPSSVDEFQPEARLTGLSGVLRTSRGHPLNQKEVAMRCARELGKEYNEANFVVAHMGGGISVTAHKKGKMVDSADCTRGEGRMAPTRSGGIPASAVVELSFSGRYTQKELLDRIQKKGGWTELLGTSDALEVERRIASGDQFAKLVYDTTAYQIAKDIGAYAAVLSGRVDAVILTGGLAHSKYLTESISKKVVFIAPVRIYPGEYEMEALASGAIRVLEGREPPMEYTGEPVFKGFDDLLKKESECV